MREETVPTIDPLYRRLVLFPLIASTTVEVIGSVAFLLWIPEPILNYFWILMIVLWIGLFLFQVNRKLINVESRSRYIAKWESEGRPTSYGAIDN